MGKKKTPFSASQLEVRSPNCQALRLEGYLKPCKVDPGLLASARVPSRWIFKSLVPGCSRCTQFGSLGPPIPPHRPHPILALSTLACPAPTGSAHRSRPVSATPPPEALARPGASGAPGSSARGCPGSESLGPWPFSAWIPQSARRRRELGCPGGSGGRARGVLGDLRGLGLSRSMLSGGRALVHGERGD